MGEFLKLVLEWLKETWPIKIVHPDEQGVRFTFGRWAKGLGPGTHFHLPFFQSIESFQVTYQEIDCQLQSIETKDGQSVCISANVGYVIRDALKMRLNVQDFDLTLERAARVHLFDTITNLPFDDLKEQLETLAKDCRRALHGQATDWGVTIKRVGITDFVRSRQYRLFGGMSL